MRAGGWDDGGPQCPIGAVRYNRGTTADASPPGYQISGGEMAGNYR